MHDEEHAPINNVLKQARRYWIRTGRVGIAHYRTAEAAECWHKRIGIPNVIITAAVATSVFATLEQDTDLRLKIATGILAVVAAILVALQAFLNLADEAEKHKSAGGQYVTLRREIDIFRLEFEDAEESEREKSLKSLKEIAVKLGSLDLESPSLSEAMFKKGEKDFDSSGWPVNDAQA